VGALAALALLAGACGGGGQNVGVTRGGGQNVGVTLRDFAIDLDRSSATSGEVTFSIRNDGPSPHELVVFRTDLAPDALPTVEESGVPVVDEEGEGVTLVDEVEDIAPGETADLTVTLQPGSYVLVCNLPAHYQQGMRAAFTVSG
jgi:uncharacterized cupredoxin-like copper-binding protein